MQLVMVADKHQEATALLHALFDRSQICQTAWAHRRGLFFEVKKLPNGKKDLKTMKNKAQNQRKKTVAAEKHVSAAIEWNPLMANGSPLVPTRHCFARICCYGSLLHTLIAIRFFSMVVRLQCHHFPCRKIVSHWQITVLRRIRRTWTCWIMRPVMYCRRRTSYSSPKMGSL